MSQKRWETFWKEQKHLAERVYKCKVKLNLTISDKLWKWENNVGDENVQVDECIDFLCVFEVLSLDVSCQSRKQHCNCIEEHNISFSYE